MTLLTPDLPPVTAHGASSLYLHHITLACAYFECIPYEYIAGLKSLSSVELRNHAIFREAISKITHVLDDIYTREEAKDPGP